MKNLTALLTAMLLTTGLFAQANADMETLLDFMTGTFNSAEQAAEDTSYLDITLHMQRIWDRDDEVWLYVEQTVTATPDRPYRQRIYRLEELGPNKFASHVYDLPNKVEYIGGWKKPRTFKNLAPDELTLMVGCTIGLLYLPEKKRFMGSTEGKCTNTWNGATIATSEVKMSDTELESWDRGWDEEGNQIWGAKNGGYKFVKE